MAIFNTTSSVFGASVVGQLPAGTAPLGSVATLQGTNPWVVVGSVYGNISGSVFSFGSGSVVAFQGGTTTSSLVSTVPSSVIVGASIFGQLPAGTAPLGSVATLQGTNPWNIAGSVAAFVAGTWKTSVINLITRNDTVSSFLGADLVERPQTGDAIGRTIIKPFASEDSTIISYVGSVVSGSVQLIQASALGKKSYVTDFWVANTGSTTTLVTLQGGDTSLLGQFIAPAGGGMVSTGINIPLKTNNAQDLAFKVSPSQSVLYLVVKGYQAQ